MPLRDVILVDASVSLSATLTEAAAKLLEARVPALAVLDDEGGVVGVFSEGDLLRAVFPGYLAEVHHTAFMPDDAPSLERLAAAARGAPVEQFAREVELLDIGDSQIHAAGRFMHTGEDALPVVEEGRFVGMVSIAALCHTRLGHAREP